MNGKVNGDSDAVVNNKPHYIPEMNGNATFAGIENDSDGDKDDCQHRSKKVSSADASPVSNSARKGFFNKISGAVIWGLETSFFRVGLFVGEYPVLSIIVPIIMCCLCGLGMKTFEPSPDQEKLWVPSAARVIDEKDWIDTVFPRETRFVSVMLVQKDNILNPTGLKALLDFYEDSLHISIDGVRFTDMCVRLGKFCYVTSLLELWQYDKNVISNLTTTDILNTINDTRLTPISGVHTETLLGGNIKYGANGTIVSAEATEITWITKKENSNAEIFEKRMIEMALKGHPGIDSTYVYATRSFDDEGYGAINSDTNLLTAGFSIVFVYVILSLGKFNLIEQKIYLSMSGMLCVGLSVLVSYGIATALSVVYSPIQAILPFLLLGIGVDDMFVVVEAWKNLTPEEELLSIPYKLATTLSKAGVSITVTSITDIVAFGIGATTVIPALSSFCIYATIGIFALFILVSTSFAGVLALDEKRRRLRRDACICCYVHPDTYTSNDCSQGSSLLQKFFTNVYGPFLMKKPVKIGVVLFAVSMTSIGMWRFSKMPKDFDLINYIPSDSYAYTYARTKEDYFNREGTDATVFCADFNYFQYAPNMNSMYERLSQSKYIQPGTIVAWFAVFNQVNMGRNFTTDAEYNHAVFEFVHTKIGSRFSSFIKFNSTTEPVSIVATKFTLTHVLQSNSDGDIACMDTTRDIIDSCGFPTFSGENTPGSKCFAYAREYLTNETIKVLLGELYRNLGLAAGAVLIVTIVLVANVQTSILVFVCVLFTVIDVGGVLELWGTTIDTASSILLTLSVGLAVDYSAHVGHTFMTVQGKRDERAVQTLRKIGPAVFNGGLSTFLAFVLLAKSASYGFQLFFRVFMSVVFFGIFHGLALLPIFLSVLGPPAYSYKYEMQMERESTIAVITTNEELHKEDSEKRPRDAEQNYSEFGCEAYDGPQNMLYEEPDDVDNVLLTTTSLPSSPVILHQPSGDGDDDDGEMSSKLMKEAAGEEVELPVPGVSAAEGSAVCHASIIDVNTTGLGNGRRANTSSGVSDSVPMPVPDVLPPASQMENDRIVANTQL